MIKDGKISGLIVMVIMLIGIIVVVWTVAKLILSRFKNQKIHNLKYDVKVTVCMIILINSIYIKFFTNQFLKYRFMEYAPVISWTFIIGLLPYNLITSVVCGIRGKKLILSTVLGTILTWLIFYLSIGII